MTKQEKDAAILCVAAARREIVHLQSLSVPSKVVIDAVDNLDALKAQIEKQKEGEYWIADE